jgi:transcriptional regulator with XRE-family HTH domain
MDIGERLRLLREYRKLSQGDIERRTGLRRCYISRVENGHTCPALETLEKITCALEVPLYQAFYGVETPKAKRRSSVKETDWASHGKGFRVFIKMRKSLSRMSDKDRQILLAVAADLSRYRDSPKS